MDKFIDNFYKDPHHLTQEEYHKVKTNITKYKKSNIYNHSILFIGDTQILQQLFILYLYFYEYTVNQNTNKKHHIAIDFEFNYGKIALMQINFNNHVWIVNPTLYTKKYLNIFADLILLNHRIYKIFHGGESLDIPYIYTELLDNDKDKIVTFTKRYIDTRFLCEYFRINKNERGKCSIYDGLLYFNTISQKKYKQLGKMNESLGPTWKFIWNIYKLSPLQIAYCYYDTLFLIDHLNDIYKKISIDTPEYVRTFHYIIQMVRFVLLERRNVSNIINSVKDFVIKANSYYANKQTLITIYQKNVNVVVQDDKGKIFIELIGKENYVKNVFDVVFKYITYYAISKKYTIYKKKNQIMTDEIKIENIYQQINDIGMYKITNLLKLYEKEISKNI